MRRLLNAGADKVSINTAAVQDPGVVEDAAGRFGSQCIVVAIDAKRAGGGWEVFTHGGRKPTGLDAVEWARRMQAAGAGEILLTSMDRDGTRAGFDLALTRAVAEAVDVPVIASGGVGNLEHLAAGVIEGKADAVLAASIFHYGEYTVRAGEGSDGRARASRSGCEPAGPPQGRTPERGTREGSPMNEKWLDEVKWDERGLVPVVAQEAQTGRVLMFAWMDRAALARTAETGEAVYYSRSRERLWRKGEESGHIQRVREIRMDCDNDVVLLKVEQVGGIACHTGRPSCFFQKLVDGRWVTVEAVAKDPREIYREMSDILDRLAEAIESRKGGDPQRSYVARLLADGEDAVLKKIGEEATETVMAGKSGDRLRIVNEMADLWFHCLVALAHYGLGPRDVLAELRRREGISGIDEKARARRGEEGVAG